MQLLGRLMRFIFRMPQNLASHGDHFTHPLDSAPAPVIDWPELTCPSGPLHAA